jgi:hypothetical protein
MRAQEQSVQSVSGINGLQPHRFRNPTLYGFSKCIETIKNFLFVPNRTVRRAESSRVYGFRSSSSSLFIHTLKSLNGDVSLSGI